MYHGVCEDRFAGEPWVPAYFVKRSTFERQVQYLQHVTNVLPLSDAIARLKDNDLPSRCVSITFDDGYANNLHLAHPLLQKYRLPATIFLATAYIESGSFFPFDRLRLIQCARREQKGPGDDAENSLLEYKSNPLDLVLKRADERWSKVRPQLSKAQYETLRPLRLEELQRFDGALIGFGTHTHTHCILRNETTPRRQSDISMSVQSLRRWSHNPVRLFSYPNGQRGDFDERDKQVLQSQGIEAAVTTICGANKPGCDLLELRRYPVGLYHETNEFIAEVTGFRSFLLSVLARRTRPHGTS